MDDQGVYEGRESVEDLRFLIVKQMLNEFPDLKRRVKEYLEGED